MVLSSRAFNSLKIDDLRRTIIKTSAKRQKLLDEAYWYKNLPEKLKVFTPHLYAVKDNISDACLELEYYPYSDLAHFYISGRKRNKFWFECLQKLLDLYENFRRYKQKYKKEALVYIYEDKTSKRLCNITEKNPQIAEMEKSKTIIINGEKKQNLSVLLPKIRKEIKKLLKYKQRCVVHGDFCFSNILFDDKRNEFKLVDPRGRFEEQTIFGDPRYDMAKLRHSITGLYDFMVAEKFELQEISENKYRFKINAPKRYKIIGQKFDELCENIGYSVNEIKFIEALLFLTMIPLHYDNVLRQKAFYLTAIEKFNEVLNERK